MPSTPERQNSLGQPIGFPVTNWFAPPAPPREPMEGTWCRLDPIDPTRDAEQLFDAFRSSRDGREWTYLGYGPFGSASEYRQWMEASCMGADPQFFSIRRKDDASNLAIGCASYLRIDAAQGVIEVGHIALAPPLQRTTAATEAMYLMMKRVFELGYRRYEWKCDALNAASRRAALRLGFQFEGIFRQHLTYKERNRDTAWFSVLDREWPAAKAEFERWLDKGNFDQHGVQCSPLAIKQTVQAEET